MIVTLIGSAGGVGQATALMLKTHLPTNSELRLVDMHPMNPGVGLDLSHIPTSVKTTGFVLDEVSSALSGSDIVIITAGSPRRPGMTRDDLFAVNGRIISELTQHAARACPTACICIVTNPVNSLVPIAARALQKSGVYDTKKLFGVTLLDVVRSRVLVSDALEKTPEAISVDVIGGHSGPTILPVLSQIPESHLTPDQQQELRTAVQTAGSAVVEAKAGNGSATLSMGYAGAQFVLSLVAGLSGTPTRTCAYIPTEKGPLPFFAKPIIVGKNGIESEEEFSLNQEEEKCLEQLLPVLTSDIEKGNAFEQ